jgi:hypothetical protein
MYKSAFLPVIAILAAAAGVLAILVSTIVGVSPIGDWLIIGAEVVFGLGALAFTVYILSGILHDIRTA